MTSSLGQPPWFSREVDPEHIAGRGFAVALDGATLRIVDPDAGTPPPLVLRSAWGVATRTSRGRSPYDFHPSLFGGVAMWQDQTLAVPRSLLSIAPERPNAGRGAYVSIDETPALSDVMEFVFVSDEPMASPSDVFMAQVLLDMDELSVDPFVVVAGRILEPLLLSLRGAITDALDGQTEGIEHLRAEVDQLEGSLRELQRKPTMLRRVIRMSLQALGAIVLSIVANRLDHAVDRIDWPILLDAINDAVRRLGVG